MIDTKKVFTLIEDDLKDLDLQVLDITYSTTKPHILQVIIDNATHDIDLDLCSKVSELVSNKLESIDINEDNYFLEVCSRGCEYELTSKEEIMANVNEFVYVEFNKLIKNVDSAKGYLLLEDDHYILDANIKGAKRKLQFNDCDIKFIRLSVKI
ncbi:MAG: hypothetical protein WBO70_01940 [Erysipelotrichaceae bacterium]